MTLSRADRQTQHLVAFLKELPEAQLIDVLAGVGASLDVPLTPDGPRHRGKSCLICGLIYPMHIKRWGNDDHPFETTPPRKA